MPNHSSAGANPAVCAGESLSTCLISTPRSSTTRKPNACASCAGSLWIVTPCAVNNFSSGNSRVLCTHALSSFRQERPVSSFKTSSKSASCMGPALQRFHKPRITSSKVTLWLRTPCWRKLKSRQSATKAPLV